MKVEGSGEIGVWEIVTHEDMEEGLRKLEGEGDVEGLSPATTACDGPSAGPTVLGQRRSSSCPPPTTEPTFDIGYGLWPTAVPEDDVLSQHGFMNNIGTSSSLPTDSMLLSADHTWATSYSVRIPRPSIHTSLIRERPQSSHQIHPREMNIPSSSTQSLPASSTFFTDPFASTSLWHPVPYDSASSLQVSPHAPLPMVPSSSIIDCSPQPPLPMPIPESQNYTHAAFDWHLTTGVSDTYACSPMVLPGHFQGPHESGPLSYGDGGGDGGYYGGMATGMEEGNVGYTASGVGSTAAGEGGEFVGGGGGGGVDGSGQSSLWASGCVAAMPVPVPEPDPFVQACHEFMYSGMPVSISDAELRSIQGLYIGDGEDGSGSFGGGRYRGHF